MRERMLVAMKNPEVARAMQSGAQNSVIDALRKVGVECTANDLVAMFTSDKELSGSELANVSGGDVPCSCGTPAAIACAVSIIGAVAAFV